MEHTPIPWEVKTQAPGGPHIWAKRIQVAFAFAGDDQPSEANADFIVRAANNHAKLLEALERCRRLIELAASQIAPEYRGQHNAYDEAADQARDVIEEARK